MKISSFNQNNKPTYNKNNVSFKAINIIQMPQKAFSELTDYIEINSKFNEILKKHMNKKPESFLQKLSKALGLTSDVPNTWLEYPSYIFSQIAMKKNKMPYSTSWLAQNTNLPIKRKIKEGYYTFFVFTGEDSKNLQKSLEEVKKNRKTNVYEAMIKYPDDDRMGRIYTVVRGGVQMDKKIIEAITKNKPTVHKLATLEELDKFAQELQ